MDKDNVIEFINVKKKYKLGSIGGGTLRGEIQSRIARLRGKEDPNTIIGEKDVYGKEFWALKGIDLQIKAGERIGVIGHNGAGKSTLLKLLSRITAPTEGEIHIRGRISSMLEVGTGFHQELTGRENIYLNASILGMTKAEVDAKLDDIIAFSECGEFIDTPVKRYSSGMFVKLAFAVAAHLDSEILIMDEVLAVGDVQFQEKCLQKMNDISRQENKTILYVSHNMNTIRTLCSRCIVLRKGQIIFDGDVSQAIELYQDYEMEEYTFKKGPRQEDEKARFLHLNFENQNTKLFRREEKMKLKMGLRSYEDLQNAHIRLIVRYPDTSVAGTYFSEELDLKKEKDYTIQYELPLKMLPEGEFYLQLILSKKLLSGNFEKYAQVDSAASFNIVQDDAYYHGLLWNEGWRVNLGYLPVLEIHELPMADK